MAPNSVSKESASLSCAATRPSGVRERRGGRHTLKVSGGRATKSARWLAPTNTATAPRTGSTRSCWVWTLIRRARTSKSSSVDEPCVSFGLEDEFMRLSRSLKKRSLKNPLA